MSKIAIDVVILPPEDIMEMAIQINTKLDNDKIILDKKRCLPHISLCMGVIEEDELCNVEDILKRISSDSDPLQLNITGISGEYSCFEIKKAKKLQRLHEKIMNHLSPYLTYDAKEAMCFSPAEIEENTLSYINNFKSRTSFENFYPHLTLAIQKIRGKKLDIKFPASKLVVCQLGNNCTCRKILIEVNMN